MTSERNRWSIVADVLTGLLALIWLLPLIFTILMSLRPSNVPITVGNIFIGCGPFEELDVLCRFTLDNYYEAWLVAPWLQHLLTSVLVVIGVLGVQMITMTLAGYAFAKLRFRGRGLLLGFILLQLMIPTGVLLVQNLTLVRELGVFDTRWALMMPYWGTAFGVLLIRQTFRGVPTDLEEAARIDGANTLQILARVYVPLSLPTYVAFALVSISARWNEFLWPFIATRTAEVRPLTVALNQLYQTTEVGAQYGELMAGTLLVIAPLVVLFLLFQRRFIESFASSGIK
ncbi:MAG: carbohydrate ABC transporter permease [Anaerolineaceae bacterium]|nr:carbohydrate ABC transporter permease [Anaerolineaceae bacterium]